MRFNLVRSLKIGRNSVFGSVFSFFLVFNSKSGHRNNHRVESSDMLIKDFSVLIQTTSKDFQNVSQFPEKPI